MKKSTLIILFIIFNTLFYNHYCFSKNSELYKRLKSLNYISLLKKTRQVNTQSVIIDSDLVIWNYPFSAVFYGNVDIYQGNIHLHADKITLHQQHGNQLFQIIDAIGDVFYENNQIILKGTKAWLNLNTEDIKVWNSDYQMIGKQGQGIANQMYLQDKNRFVILENGSFTLGLPGCKKWTIVGSKIIQDRLKEVAEIWNARLKLGNLPIFYIPYWKLSIGNRRHSGFLIPKTKYSNNNGFEFNVPYHWNISPTVDFIIMSHYRSKRRDIQLQNEFRYLTKFGSGLMEFDFLLAKPKNLLTWRRLSQYNSSNRWFFYWQHSGVYNNVWRFNADYTKVNNPSYFNELDSKYHNSKDTYETHVFSFGYANINWNAIFSIKDFKRLRNITNNNTYRANPEFNVNIYPYNLGPFNVHLYAQAVKFTNLNNLMPQATRFHFEPGVDYLIFNDWSRLNAEAKLLITYYKQNRINYYNRFFGSYNNVGLLKKNVNRTLPEFNIDGNLVFIRNNMHAIKGFIQTLEPHIQYSYIPYRDQSNIYLYDSILLKIDNNYNFRNRFYSGLDRICPTNALKTSFNTLIYNNYFNEVFNFSIGQIYNLNKFYDITKHSDYKKEYNNNRILWSNDLFWNISRYWECSIHSIFLKKNMFYNYLYTSNASLKYHFNTHSIILNYRYVNKDYFTQDFKSSDIVNNNLLNKKNGLSQISINVNWLINKSWSFLGKCNYNIYNKLYEQMIGLQYNSCGCFFNLKYQHKTVENNNHKYDNQISLNISI